MNPDALEEARKIVEEKRTLVELKEDTPDKLYIEARCFGENNSSKAIICGSHNNIVYVEANGEVLHDEFSSGNFQQGESSEVKLDFNRIYDFAMETPVDDLHFMLEAARLNKMAAEESYNFV